MDKDEIGRKVMETSQTMAEGYTRAISEHFMTEAQKTAGHQCAVAASNTGYFILRTLGFEPEEIKALRSAYDVEKAALLAKERSRRDGDAN